MRTVTAFKSAVLQRARDAGAEQKVLDEVGKAIDQEFPPKTYLIAAWFLGVAALILVSGAVLAVLLEKPTSEAFWVSVGAALGALAGIFAGTR
jgi:hypothetical protein